MIVGIILATHSILGWFVLLLATKSGTFIFSFGLPLSFGILSGMVFLYIFNHDKVIRIARLIEEKEEKIEERWLKHFAHSGKLASCFLMGMIGGPVLAALTIRLLLPKFKHKYSLVTAVVIVNTIFYVGFLKGTLGLII